MCDVNDTKLNLEPWF